MGITMSKLSDLSTLYGILENRIAIGEKTVSELSEDLKLLRQSVADLAKLRECSEDLKKVIDTLKSDSDEGADIVERFARTVESLERLVSDLKQGFRNFANFVRHL